VAKYLFLAFVVVPLLELYLLITLGRQLGVGPTLGLIVVSGLLGSWLARREGLRVMRTWQAARAEGRVPEEGIMSGVLVLLGGVLLIVPGVLTDAVGLFLLIPPARRWVSARMRRALERGMKSGSVHVTTYGGVGVHRQDASPSPRPTLGEVRGGEVDAEFTEEGPKR
jgi:UPF0716 protein FxsA